MTISKERKIKEAVERMKLLGLHPDAIEQFEKEGLINISEPPFGGLYWAEGEILAAIREWEKISDEDVYHVISSRTEFGRMLAYFYVSNYVEEWASERADFEFGEAFVWVRNVDDEYCSEPGYIGFERTPAAGLLRTW